MEDALDKVRWFQHTDKIMNDRPRRDVRSMLLPSSNEEGYTEEDSYSVSRAFQREPDKPKVEKKVHFPQQESPVNKRMDKLEGKVESIDEKIDKLVSSLQSVVSTVNRSRSPVRSRSPARSPTRGCCYKCGKE